MIENMERALQDVDLECAFAIFYFVGEPMAELAEHSASAEGVIGWAKAKHPAALARMVVGVSAVVRGTLEQMAATQQWRERVLLARDNPAPRPQMMVTKGEWPERALVNPQVVALAEQEQHEADAIGANSLNPMCVTPLPAPESGVEWEQPSLNTFDGSEDWELEP